MGRILRSYFFWTYERGSFHYDVMVTLILAFVFLSPHWINFKDKPIERVPHQTGVLITPDGKGGFVYQIDASAIAKTDLASSSSKDEALREQFAEIIEPISGAVAISRVEEVHDGKGRLMSYKVWVEKE